MVSQNSSGNTKDNYNTAIPPTPSVCVCVCVCVCERVSDGKLSCIALLMTCEMLLNISSCLWVYFLVRV